MSIRQKAVSDDAVKILRVDRGDDVALLGYSGLGKTPKGKQPSEWMNNVLRGRNEPLERSLEILGGAISRQILKYLLHVPGMGNAAHVVLAPAFVAEKPILYTVKLDIINAKKKLYRISNERHETVGPPRRYTRIGIAGSGTPFIVTQRPKLIALLRLISKHEKGKITAFAVAREFAKINLEVAGKDNSVGPDCVVAWSYRRNGPLKLTPNFMGFKGLATATGHLSLPTNSNGTDMTAFMAVLFPSMMERMANLRAGKDGNLSEADQAAITEALNKLPTRPSEHL
ncbi:hypothetical protein [Bradyrhizobium erythrophlei]|uniref:hypothetical protein n=1 Tax=Bradyrhizobium erythrophlei TaxID=1437360 RepID=UPI0015610D5C|nr:hypothetical protein [Bradyrhizobium erythrophlei]